MLIFHGDPHRHRLHALEPSGRLEMGALFAAVQGGPAFGAGTAEHRSGRQCRGATVTTRRSDGLHQAGKPGTRNIQRRARTGRLGFEPIAIAVGVAAGSLRTVVITVLPVLSIGVHADQNSCFFPAPGCGRGVLALNSKSGTNQTSLEIQFGRACGHHCRESTALQVPAGRYTSLLPRIVSAVQITFVNTW